MRISDWSADVCSSYLVSFTVERFGRLDILHNNAGYVGADLARDTKVTDIPFELWDKTMAINLRAYFAGCRFAIPHMVRGDGGAIVNTASGSDFVGDIERVTYGTYKGGAVSLTKNVPPPNPADGIRCPAILPGLIIN